MMTFDDLKPGATLGECQFDVTTEAVEEWSALFPDDRSGPPVMPAAMMAMVVMRAFMTIMKDRPRGNVHAGQKFWIAQLPSLHDRLTTRLHCVRKELKNNRRWATFETNTMKPAGALSFRGQMTTIWAA